MTEGWKSGRLREPSGPENGTDGIEVTERKTTKISEDLNTRQTGRLKQEGGRLRDGSAEDSAGATRSRRYRQRHAFQRECPTADEANEPETNPAPFAADTEVEVSARRESTLAEELGVEQSGRLKQGTSRRHGAATPGAATNSDKPTRPKGGRLRSQSPRLRAGGAGDAARPGGDEATMRGTAPGHAGKLRPSKGARHVLRFAEDAGAVADAATMNDSADDDVGEDAIRETGRKIAPAGNRAFSDRPRARSPKANAPADSGIRNRAGASTRLRDGPASLAVSDRRAASDGIAAPAGKGRGAGGIWRRGRWKKTARAEAAARKAAATGEAGALKGVSTLKARIRRMFVAGGGGRAAIAMAAAAAFAIVFAASALSTCTTIAMGVMQAMAATSYTADDGEIKDFDAAYTSMEASLEGEAQAAESNHPGYDEYRYQIGELGHDPYALASILTARYGAYNASQVTGFLQEILDAQYDLTFEETTETETVTTIDPDTGNETTRESTRRILTVRLMNRGLDYAARQLLTEEELASYEATYAAKGNRDYLFPTPYAGNFGSTGAGFDWSPPGEAMSDAKFAAMYAEGSKYLGWPYVWGGGSPDTGFDCSGFVSWVLTASGVANTGRQITDGLLSFCIQVSREQARPGDLVFFTGTYETDLLTSHVGIYLGDGMMMHCGDPIQITSIDTPYWQAHLYGFGRIK